MSAASWPKEESENALEKAKRRVTEVAERGAERVLENGALYRASNLKSKIYIITRARWRSSGSGACAWEMSKSSGGRQARRKPDRLVQPDWKSVGTLADARTGTSRKIRRLTVVSGRTHRGGRLGMKKVPRRQIFRHFLSRFAH